LENKLDHSWPNLKGPSNEDFWKYEWRRHGRCSYNNFNQPRYFQLAEDIWSRKDLFDILRQEGISPSLNVSHPRQNIIDAIQNHNSGLTPELFCTNELLEIRLCLDELGNNYMSCPSVGNCKSFISWKP
jgi:ribonuclease T2